MYTRDELIQELKAELDKINAQIDKLQAKAAEVSSDARAIYEQQMKELRAMAKPVEDMLARARAAGEEQWDRLEAEAVKTYKALLHSYNYFKSQMK